MRKIVRRKTCRKNRDILAGAVSYTVSNLPGERGAVKQILRDKNHITRFPRLAFGDGLLWVKPPRVRVS